MSKIWKLIYFSNIFEFIQVLLCIEYFIQKSTIFVLFFILLVIYWISILLSLYSEHCKSSSVYPCSIRVCLSDSHTILWWIKEVILNSYSNPILTCYFYSNTCFQISQQAIILLTTNLIICKMTWSRAPRGKRRCCSEWQTFRGSKFS